MKDNELKIMIEYYNKGLNDREISELMNVTQNKICKTRTKYNLKPNSHNRLSYDDIKNLILENKTDSFIANVLNCSKDGIYAIRKKLNIERISLNKNQKIEFNENQLNVLIGTVLGDSHLGIGKDCINPYMSCEHCMKQHELNIELSKIFYNFNCNVSIYNRFDKRSDTHYTSSNFRIPANEGLINIYNSFYLDKIKHIPFNLLNKFNEQSLAWMFMDDGSKLGSGFTIATNCFKYEELVLFNDFLHQKFDLNISIHKYNKIYIDKKSSDTFINIINPFILECVKYKVGS